ncbi:uncharacterized protein LODBEIA_P14110 [Lodderomyces beijingensis]|uniref:Alpha-1,3-mannosyltransferase n=1 Tax=Lodderomyces beijingensis TaxID=1775926 RepID=A0ABP0ZLW8_9ASCO
MIEKLTANRSKQRIFVYSGVLIWLVIINIWLFYTYHSRATVGNYDASNFDQPSIYDQYDPSNADAEDSQNAEGDEKSDSDAADLKPPKIKSLKDDITVKLLQKQQSKAKDVRGVDAHARIYDIIFQNHEIDSIFGNLDFEQRCDLFFQNLFMDDKNWIFQINEVAFLENKEEFRYNDYRKHYYEQLKNEYSDFNHRDPASLDNTPELEEFIRHRYDEFWNRMMVSEQKIVDQLSIFRVFNKCYLTSDNTTQIKRTEEFINSQHKLINGISQASKKSKGVAPFQYTKQESLINFKTIKHSAFEHRVYPWLSLEYPIFERYTGQVLYKPPIMSEYVNDEAQKTSKHFKDGKDFDFFLRRFKNSCNGKGIVLSIGDKHVEDTVRLMHLLRALNNKFPIQIVYYDDLSPKTKKRIVTAAREPMAVLPKSFEKVSAFFPDDYISPDGGLPKQEIWFVNTYNVIHHDFKEKFKGYANKFLATVFNSFDEFMLIDADTVMFQNPEYFFNLQGYKDTGTYFYKDRSTLEHRPDSDAKFFKKIGPSIIDSVMFDIPIMTKHSVDNEFMRGLYHFQESGVVMLNRKINFNAILMMLQLNFYEPINGRVHGDKELFWLGLAVSGNDNYVFNENHAAAVGKVTPPTERSRPDGSTHASAELCSCHPGHISTEDSALVWMNSGFFYCSKAPKLDFDKEASHQSRLKFLKTAEQFKTFYYAPLRIESAIVPPLDIGFWASNKEDEPKRGWFMDPRYCAGYMWCAYSSIGGLKDDGESNRRQGRLIDFSDKERNLFTYYGDIWIGSE